MHRPIIKHATSKGNFAFVLRNLIDAFYNETINAAGKSGINFTKLYGIPKFKIQFKILGVPIFQLISTA